MKDDAILRARHEANCHTEWCELCEEGWPCTIVQLIDYLDAVRDALQNLVADNERRGMSSAALSWARNMLRKEGDAG